jgi:actin-related protein
LLQCRCLRRPAPAHSRAPPGPSPWPQREAIAHLAFEGLGARGFFVCDAAASALFTCNKQAGLCVDVGHGKAVVSAVFEGATHVAGAAALPWAGQRLEPYVARLLAGRGGGGSAAAAAAAAALTPEQLRAIKEQAACLAASAEDYELITGGDARRAAAAGAAAAAAAADKAQQQQAAAHAAAWAAARGRFTLPDGTALELGHTGYMLGEALMRPRSAGLQAPALAEVCCEVVGAQMEPSARRAAWDSILVCGGAGSMPGFKERLLTELPLYAPPSASFGLAQVPNYLPPVARTHTAWFGGTILARVCMHQMITGNEYDEHGPAVVNRII